MTDPTTSAPSHPPYFWFTGASVRELYDRLTAIGPDAARVEVHPLGEKCYLRVKPLAAGASVPAPTLPDINDSFICPPWCG